MRFAGVLTLLAAAVAGLVMVLKAKGIFRSSLHPALILIFMWGLTVWSFWFVRRQPAENFVRAYLITAVLRMASVVVWVGIVVVDDPGGVVANVIFLLSLYVVFMTAEIVALSRKK